MFKVTGDFSQGVMTNGFVNGFSCMVFQHQMDLENAVKDFENAIKSGLDPNDAAPHILRKNNLTNLSREDKAYLERKIEAIYESHNNTRY